MTIFRNGITKPFLKTAKTHKLFIFCSLVSFDIRFLPSALIISRTLLEAYSKLIWLIEPDDILTREIRFFDFLIQEEEHINKYIRNLKELDNDCDISDFESDKKEIKKIREYIRTKLHEESQNQLNCNYSNLLDDKSKKQEVNFQELLKKIDQKGIYLTYRRLSQSVHANHAALWLYKDKESIVEKDWYTPLYFCYFTLANSASIYLKRYSDDFDESLISEKSKELKKALNNLA